MKGTIFMIKARSRIAAVFLALSMAFAMLPMNVLAAGDSSTQDVISIEDDSSVKESTFSSEEFNRHYELYYAEMNEDKTVRMSYSSEDDCIALAVVYREVYGSDLLVAYNSVSLPANATSDDGHGVTISFGDSEIPDKGLLRVFLLDQRTYAPLCANQQTIYSLIDESEPIGNGISAVSGSDAALTASNSASDSDLAVGVEGVRDAALSLATDDETTLFQHTYSNSEYFDDLEPATMHLFTILKDPDAANPFAPGNLLAVEQVTSLYDGSAFFGYAILKENKEYEANINFFCNIKTDISQAAVTAPSTSYTGEARPPKITVTLNGEPLVEGINYDIISEADYVKTGTYHIEVEGKGMYKGRASGSYSIIAPDIVLNFSSLTIQQGTNVQLNACFTEYPFYDGFESWQSSNENVATVSDDGIVTAMGTGKATITVTAKSGDTAKCVVTVVNNTKSTDDIIVKKTKLQFLLTNSKPTATATLTATVKGNSSGKTWFSSNPSVANVTSNGKVTAYKDGTTNIYCRTADGAISNPCEVTVHQFMIIGEGTQINNIAYVSEGNESYLYVLASDYSDNLIWQTSNKNIAEIVDTEEQRVTIKAKKKGTVTVTVTAKDNKQFKSQVKLSVVKPSQNITPNRTNKRSVYEGSSITLKATLDKGSNAPVTWYSSDSKVATVTAKGVVKGIQQGTVLISASTLDGLSVSIPITVRSKAKSIAISGYDYFCEENDTGTVSVEFPNQEFCNDTITWSTSNKKLLKIIGISPDGKSIQLQSSYKGGLVTITAKSGSGKRATVKIPVVTTPANELKLNMQTADLYVGKSVTAKIAKKTSYSDDRIYNWESSAPSVATVDQNGKITGKSAGECDIYAYSVGAFHNLHELPVIHVTVRQKAERFSVDTTAATIAKGDTVTLNVTELLPTNCNDKIVWTSGSKSIAEVTPSADGMSAVVTGKKKGTAIITAKTVGGKSQKIKITVTN